MPAWQPRVGPPKLAPRLTGVASGLIVSLTAAAQPPLYRDVTATHLPPALAGPCMDAAAGDVDGDGDLDLALAMEFQANILLLNDGSAVFTNASRQLPQAIHDSEDVAFADFDRDGDLDIVLVSEDDGTDELYLNDGAGRFADASDRLGTHEVSNALALIDLDANGALDILIGNVGANHVLLNDGRGRFRDDTRTRWPQTGDSRTQDLELVDVDGDGDLDVVVGNEGQNQLYLNEAGRLSDVSAARLPSLEDETREIKAGDIDGDGDLDLVVANVRFILEESRQDYMLLNDGTGVFSRADRERFPEDARDNFTTQLVDVDRDGDLDVLAPSTVFARNAAGDYLVLRNDGSGRFTVAEPGTVLPLDSTGNGFDIELADFDADGVTDLFLCNRASAREPAAAAISGGQQRLLLGRRVDE